MNCNILNVGGCVPPQITDALHFLQMWGVWIGLGLAALVLLYVLAKVKEVAGWPGVVTVLLIIVTFGGYAKGRADQKAADTEPTENLDPDSPDAEVPDRPNKSLLGRSLKDLFR